MKKPILLLACLGMLFTACARQPVTAVIPTIDPAILTQIAPTREPTDQPTIGVVIPTATMTVSACSVVT